MANFNSGRKEPRNGKTKRQEFAKKVHGSHINNTVWPAYAEEFAIKVASIEMGRLNKLFDPESLNLDDGFNSKTSEEQELIISVLIIAQTTDITIGQSIKNKIYTLRDAAYKKAYDDFMSNVPASDVPPTPPKSNPAHVCDLNCKAPCGCCHHEKSKCSGCCYVRLCCCNTRMNSAIPASNTPCAANCFCCKKRRKHIK